MCRSVIVTVNGLICKAKSKRIPDSYFGSLVYFTQEKFEFLIKNRFF
jgi:hypothetical protein